MLTPPTGIPGWFLVPLMKLGYYFDGPVFVYCACSESVVAIPSLERDLDFLPEGTFLIGNFPLY